MKNCFPLLKRADSGGNTLCLADGLADNAAANVRPVPPPGLALAAPDKTALEQA